MMKNLLAVSTVALIAGIASNASAACGTVSVANMNWQSGELLAHVDKFILEHGFGCQVEFVPGDTVPTITSMVEKGQPDIAGEAWVDLGVMDCLRKRSWDNQTVSSVMSWMTDTQAGGEDGAVHFFKEHPEIWKSWLSADVAEKVTAAL